MKKREIFISYRRVDNKNNEIEKFKNALISKFGNMLDIFFDADNLENGDFPDNLRTAVENCDCFLPIVTENYVDFRKKEDWCKEELKTAIKNNKLIVPIFACDIGKIKNERDIDLTAEDKRSDINNVNNWSDSDLIAVLSRKDAVPSKLTDEWGEVIEETVLNVIKSIFNSFCKSDKIPLFFNVLKKQREIFERCSISSTSYTFKMENYIDLGITGKPTEKEREEARKKTRAG